MSVPIKNQPKPTLPQNNHQYQTNNTIIPKTKLQGNKQPNKQHHKTNNLVIKPKQQTKNKITNQKKPKHHKQTRNTPNKPKQNSIKQTHRISSIHQIKTINRQTCKHHKQPLYQ